MPEALRLFVLCEGMNWAQLPVDGGLYNQHPILLDAWLVIWGEQGNDRARKEALDERKGKKKGRGR